MKKDAQQGLAAEAQALLVRDDYGEDGPAVVPVIRAERGIGQRM